MSHTLTKLIDIALIPAALLVIGKLVGLMLTINLFDLPWSLKELPGGILSVRPALMPDDVVTASSYSDLIMYLIIAIGFTFVLIQATHFHETHINPRLLIKLSSNNLTGLVKSSYDIYHTATIWLIFIWISCGIIWLNVLTGKTLSWVAIATLVANIIFTTILLQDVYREIETSKRNLGTKPALS